MRRDRLRKLLAVQSKLREIAELRLQRLREEEARLKRETTETIEALNGAGPFHGLFVAPMARRLQDLSSRLTHASSAVAKQQHAAIMEAARTKHLERLTASAATAHDRQQERKELLEIAEASLRKNPASLP